MSGGMMVCCHLGDIGLMYQVPINMSLRERVIEQILLNVLATIQETTGVLPKKKKKKKKRTT